jgi:hypothetical protein
MTASHEKYIPILSRRGANYPAGAESWQNTAQRVALSAGAQAAGFEPNSPIDAQSLNWLLGALGEHVEGLADAPSLNWAPQPVYKSADLSADTTGNRNETDDPPLIYAAGDRWIVKTVGGGTGVCFHSYLQGRGLEYESDSDTNPFAASADSGAGATAAILTGPYVNRILAVSGAGVVRYSDNYGATWSAGGTTVGSYQPDSGGRYNNRWVECHNAGSTGAFDISYSTTLSGAWTLAASFTGVDAQAYRRMITNSTDTAIFLPDSCDAVTEFLVDTGAGFSRVDIGAGASAGWRGCYHDLLDKFFAVNLAGQIWSSTAPDTSWALEGTVAAGAYDIAPHGRGLVVSTETEDFSGPATFARLSYVYWDRDQAFQERKMPWSSPAQLYPRFHLVRHRGRVIAARLNVGASLSERLEYWASHAHPANIKSTGL